jgi:signal transduction histidine kinase
MACVSAFTDPDELAGRAFRTEFLASMAHELRAPLQGVSGFTSFLLEGKAGPLTEAQRSCLEQIGLGADHVLQIVQDVLDVTDSAADALHVRAEVVDAEQAVREVLRVLQVIAIRRHIHVQVHVDDRLGHVVSDGIKIKQILYNFVSNALKYTPAQGHVEIGLRREDADSFCIDVRDTGPGLPAHVLAQLSAPNVRGSSPSNRGLSVTRRIAEALGGSISAHNGTPSGAVLRARLPLAPSVAQPDPEVPLPRSSP